MSKLQIHQIPTRKDNYGYLMRESSSGKCAVVDPSDAAPVLDTLAIFGWKLTHVLATHHHFDSVEAAVREGKDIIPTVSVLRQNEPARTVGDTERGAEMRREIEWLGRLAQAQRENRRWS